MENKELLEQVSSTIEKSLPEVVESVVEKKFTDNMEQTWKELENMKSELKNLSLESKKSDPAISKKYKEAFMVSLVKDIVDHQIASEKGFNDAIERTSKTMNTGTATE